jgi:hypothetical protein
VPWVVPLLPFNGHTIPHPKPIFFGQSPIYL